MLGLLAFVAALLATVYAYRTARSFGQRRLRYTRVAEQPTLFGLGAACGTALLAAPVVGILPLVGMGTALAVGAGVGTGLARGVRAPLA